MNRVTIMGRVGKDPEMRSFQSGDKVANFSIATSERWKDKTTGEKKEKTEWHSVAVFGPAADVVEKYVHKGDQILIEGSLQTRKWQDQSGTDRYTTEVVVKGFSGSVHLIGGAKGGGDSGRHNDSGAGSGDDGHSSGRDYGDKRNPPQTRNDLDDEIPF